MSTTRPRVTVIGTGGSIAGVGSDRLDYTRYGESGKRLTIEESLARLPEVNDIAQVEGEDFFSLGSSSIVPADWIRMTERINQIFREDPGVAGVAITHGTASLEETSYFLHLTVKHSKPVVLTAAMRPPTAMSNDADLNIIDAVRVAACPDAAGKGVLTVCNNEIQSARDVTKSNNNRVETFRPNELGFLGYCDSDGEVVFYRTPTRKHTTETRFDVAGLQSLPRVDMVYSYLGADEMLVDAVRNHGSDGLVLVGFGGPGYTPAMWEAGLQAARDGMTVVLASRATAGRMNMTPRKEELAIGCDNLLPQKARILLMLALTVTHDREEIRQMFREY